MRRIILGLSLCLALPAMAEDGAFDLTVKITNALPAEGQVLVNLFDSEDTYMKEPRSQKAQSVDESGDVEIVFERLSAGDYAVTVVHDANGNGELDTNFFGMPKENIGFSNNAEPRFGPAPYEDARFTLSGEGQAITIKLGSARPR